ncbi:MAG: hypothetical protein ACREK7_08975 [Gemmatimonadota bacterium]
MRVLLRILATGVAAAAAWWVGVLVVFGPAQAILADPDRQSTKFLSAFTEPPLPRMAERPEILPLGLVLVGLIYACTYERLGKRLPGTRIHRGLTFGLVTWALMVPWFEFYLPWNVMREPLPLVLLETLCWLVVLLGVGVAIAVVHDKLSGASRGRAEGTTSAPRGPG